MPLENDDIAFDELLADKRHKELKAVLNNLVQAINKKTDSEIVKAIENQNDSEIRGFAEAIKLLAAPEVNVDVDLKLLEVKADKIIDNQEKSLAVLNKILQRSEELKEWNLSFTKDNNGIVSPIRAKQIK